MIKVVPDTNILISAIVFGGPPREILEKGVEGRLRLFVSDAILEELAAVLKRSKFNYPPPVIRTIIGELEIISERVVPLIRLDVIEKDPDDNRVLECAVASAADVIVSGDKHLLDLEAYEGIKILKPADFLRRFFSE